MTVMRVDALARGLDAHRLGREGHQRRDGDAHEEEAQCHHARRGSLDLALPGSDVIWRLAADVVVPNRARTVSAGSGRGRERSARQRESK